MAFNSSPPPSNGNPPANSPPPSSQPNPGPMPGPFQCPPDQCLTQEHLDVLYNDFNVSISSPLSNSSVFSNLVNGVRQLYLSKLAEQQQQLDIQTQQHEQQISEMTEQHEQELLEVGRERKEERAVLLKCVEEAIAGRKPTNVLPANTQVLYVRGGTRPRRDMVDWDNGARDQFTQRLYFKVFRLLEINTIKVTIAELRDPHRINVLLGNVDLPVPWTERLHFFAFGCEQPGTVMISVGQAIDRDPERCIFVRGEHVDKLSGWEEKFVFWVPV